MRNAEIVKIMQEAKATKTPMNREIYNDGCWTVCVELHPNGIIRFWAGYEDKRDGRSGGTFCTCYDSNGSTVCASNFTLKPMVKKKIVSAWRELYRKGLVK